MDTRDIPECRLYGELAFLWPIMSAPEEYAEEAAHWRALLVEKLGEGRHAVLELGVGGGHNLSHLTDDIDATAVDISENMLAHSRRLNPSVVHHLGDMRNVRLGERFKAVLIHDAIGHMLTEEDLAAVFQTAAAHLEKGGVMIVTPDRFRDTFECPHVEVDTRISDSMRLTWLEYTHDPDPDDSALETVFTYMIESGRTLRIEHDRMLTGVFAKATWARLIEEAGFQFEERLVCLDSAQAEYVMLVGVFKGG